MEEGDYVLCAISGKKIPLQDLNYWNVDLQEAYYSPKKLMKDLSRWKNNLFPPVVCPNPLT